MATQNELEATIARLQAEQRDIAQHGTLDTTRVDTVMSGDIDGEHGGLNLNIRDEAFECRHVDVSYQMMKFAVAQRKAQVVIPKGMPEGPRKTELETKRNAAGMTLMDIMLSTVMILLKPHERERFDTFMEDLGMSDNPLKPGEFQDAIGEVIAAAGGQEGKESKGGTTSSQSSYSSQTTNANYVDSSADKAGVADKLAANV